MDTCHLIHYVFSYFLLGDQSRFSSVIPYTHTHTHTSSSFSKAKRDGDDLLRTIPLQFSSEKSIHLLWFNTYKAGLYFFPLNNNCLSEIAMNKTSKWIAFPSHYGFLMLEDLQSFSYFNSTTSRHGLHKRA